MNTCPTCDTTELKQAHSFLSRLILSSYVILVWWAFGGDVGIGVIMAILPIIIPYPYICQQCNRIELGLAPQCSVTGLIGVNDPLSKMLIAWGPSMLVIALLIDRFPYTGLGRIAYLPAILFTNTALIVTTLFVTRKLNLFIKGLLWIACILLTLWLAVAWFPQEYNPPVIEQLWGGLNKNVQAQA